MIINEKKISIAKIFWLIAYYGFARFLPVSNSFGGIGGKIRRIICTHIFKKVGAIYDGDKRDDYELFCRDYGKYGYMAWIIPADDVRDKPKRAAMQGKLGLVDEKGSIKKEYSEDMTKLFRDINAFLHR